MISRAMRESSNSASRLRVSTIARPAIPTPPKFKRAACQDDSAKRAKSVRALSGMGTLVGQ